MSSNADDGMPEQESGPEEAQESSPTNPNLTHVPGHPTEDPVPPAEGASDETWIAYRARLVEYASVWCSAYRHILHPRPEIVWGDFTNDFSPVAIQNLEVNEILRLREVLLSNNVHVSSGRGYSRKKALVECWEAESCPRHPVDAAESVRLINQRRVRGDGSVVIQAADATGRATEVVLDHSRRNITPRNMSMAQTTGTSSDRAPYFPGLSGLMKAYAGRDKYSGGWDEDLLGNLEVYEMSCRMCDLDPEQMLKGIVVMLSGPALAYYASHLKDAKTYDEVVDGLISAYTSEEQRSRLLREWQTASLTAWMRKNPEMSEVAAFRDLFAYLNKIQRQLHPDYRKDRFLKDQLVTSADIPQVARALREKVPQNSHEASQRIAALLSSEPNSAGSFTVSCSDDEEIYYGLGQRYRGQAQRRISFPQRRPRFRRKDETRKKLALIKGCWVCGKDHLAWKFHSEKEISAALEEHKKDGVYLSIEGVADFAGQYLAEMEDESDEDGERGLDSAMLVDEVSDINCDLEKNLANNAFAHSCGFVREHSKRMKEMTYALSDCRESQAGFNGILMDTGANRSSVISLSQYLAYCREYGIPASLDKSKAGSVRGLGGKQSSLGTATILIPFYNLQIVADVEFRVIEDDTVPTLLSLSDMKRIGIDMSIQRNCVSFLGKEQKLVYENGFLYHRWRSDYALYTTSELSKLHRSFGHPSVTALCNLLKRARPDEMKTSVRAAIEDITKRCNTCAEFSSRPKRFRLSVGAEDLHFNSIVAADVMYINQKPVLHVVDEATHFCAALFLRSMSAADTWNALVRCWSNVYLGPPDYLRIDQGTNFVAKEFKGLAATEGVELLEAPVESPSTMSHVERYHGPLRTAFIKLRNEISFLPKEDILQMAVYCVNNTVGPEGLCPTLCVFGAIPSPARQTPAPTQIERARAIDSAMKELQRYHAQRKVSLGMKYRGPFGKERSDLDNIYFGAPVRVYRETSKTWEGPHKFVSKDGETVVVQMPHGHRIFRSHVVRPVPLNSIEPSQDLINLMVDDDAYAYTVPTDEHTFVGARNREVKGLFDQKVFEVVDRSNVPQGFRIYGTKWVDLLKTNDDGSALEKSRLVAQNFRDFSARNIPTKAPTISQMGERIALTIAVMHPEGQTYVRDVTQAYVQSESELEREVYLEPVPEMNLPKGKVLGAVKPLYGVPESGLHWFITYRDHHEEKLGMKCCTVDNCLLYRREIAEKVPDIVMLQVDDSFGAGSRRFIEEEQQYSTEFRTKPRKILDVGMGSMFNGAYIKHESRGLFSLSQWDKLSALVVPKTSDEAVSLRARIQYIATTTRPDLSSPSQLLSTEVINPIRSTFRKLKDLVNYCHATQEFGLKFVSLDANSLRVLLFTDASFGNAHDLSSQLGVVVIVVDASNTANIIHYGSQKCRRVTRSVMAAEVLALVHGFDTAFVVKHTFFELLGRDPPIDVYVDSRTTFNCVAKNAATLEKRLQIDVAALRESHSLGEIHRLGWIPGSTNPADGLTREKILENEHPLMLLMKNNKIVVHAEGWTESGI